jgi:hypothetical protein
MRKMMILALIPLALAAQNKVGTSGTTFLKINASAHAQGMGETFVAVANDASTLFHNPAGIANVEGSQVFAGATEWLVSTRLPAACFVTDLGRLGKVGVMVGGVYSDGFIETKVNPEEPFVEYTGVEFTYMAAQFGVAYGKYFTDKFAAGFMIKGIYEGFGDYASGMSVALDAGTYFKTGYRSLRIAMALQHLGPDITPTGTYILHEGGSLDPTERTRRAHPLPLLFRIGAAMEVLEDEEQRLTIALEAVHPNDSEETAALGGEYAFREMVFLRSGYVLNKDEGAGLSAGIGVKVGRIAVDYAFSDLGSLPDVHRIGLSVGL